MFGMRMRRSFITSTITRTTKTSRKFLSQLVPPASWSLSELQLHDTSTTILNDTHINDLCKLACINITTTTNSSLRKDIVGDVNTILRCSRAIEIEKQQLSTKSDEDNEIINPYFHSPLQYSSLREDLVEKDEGIHSFFENNKDRIIESHFAVPKLKTDGNIS